MKSSSLIFVCPLLFLMLFFIAGCSPRMIQDAYPASGADMLQINAQDATFGQSFVARHAGLQGVKVYLAASGVEGEGDLTLHVRSSALPGEPDLRVARLHLTLPAKPGWYAFDFQPLQDTNGKLFYFYIENTLPAGTALQLGHSPAESYTDGAMYLNNRAQENQLAFQLSFDTWSVVFDLVQWFGWMLMVCLMAFLLFILPGFVVQALLLPPRTETGEAGTTTAGITDISLKERLCLGIGLSIALYPLILLWAKVVGVRPGSMTVWGLLLLSCLGTGWIAIRSKKLPNLRAWSQSGSGIVYRRETFPVRLPDLVWLVAVGLVVFVRLFLLRSVDTPQWGDSVQHVVMGQLFVDNGGLFDSWLPYAPYASLTVHYGFHTMIAAIMWLSGVPVLTATLLAGQLANIFAIIALSAIAVRLAQNPWAGTGATIVAGLLLPLPNQYTDWGRYSQLAGQILMPVSLWLIWYIYYGRRDLRLRSVLAGAILFAGTFLSYYRMPAYVVAFTGFVVVVYAIQHWRNGWRTWSKPLLVVAGSALLALLLVLPWLLHLRGSNLALSAGSGPVLQGSLLDSIRSEYDIFQITGQFYPPLVFAAAILAMLVGLLRKNVAVILVSLWSLSLLAFPALRILQNPGVNNLEGFAVLISAYIPLGILAGYGIDFGLGWLSRHYRVVLPVALAVLLVVSLAGMRDRLHDPNQQYRILAPADIRAMQWIQTNVPANAFFLVDGFLVYSGASVVGSDGGWYLPLLAHRNSTMPPQYALTAEKPLDPGYNTLIVELVTRLRKVGVTSNEGIQLLCRSKITHVYVGQGQGRIAIPPPEAMLSLDALERSPAFTELYRQDKVGVFALNESACR